MRWPTKLNSKEEATVQAEVMPFLSGNQALDSSRKEWLGSRIWNERPTVLVVTLSFPSLTFAELWRNAYAVQIHGSVLAWQQMHPWSRNCTLLPNRVLVTLFSLLRLRIL